MRHVGVQECLHWWRIPYPGGESLLSRWQSAFVHSLLITPPSGTGERAASAVDKLRPKPKVSIPFEPITLVCKDIR